jgi:hypothetical protein
VRGIPQAARPERSRPALGERGTAPSAPQVLDLRSESPETPLGERRQRVVDPTSVDLGGDAAVGRVALDPGAIAELRT